MLRPTFLFAIACLTVPTFCGPIFVVAPNSNATVVGNSPDGNEGDTGDIRSQEDVGIGQFSAFSGPVWITEVSFRAVPGTGPVNTSISNVDLYLSTSPFFPNGGSLISSTFANNIGPDNTLVFSGPFKLSSPGCAAGSTPCPFDMVATFTTPFLYNKAKGTLLLDFRLTGLNGISGTLDGVEFTTPGGPVATVSGGISDTSGNVDLGGDVIRLTVVTPEPSSLALMLCGLGAIASLIRRRRASRDAS